MSWQLLFLWSISQTNLRASMQCSYSLRLCLDWNQNHRCHQREVLLRIDQTQTLVFPLFSAHQEYLSSPFATFGITESASRSVCLKCSKTFPQVSSIVTRPLGVTKMYVMYVCMCVQPTISAVGHVVYNARLNRIVGDKWHGSSKLDFGIMGCQTKVSLQKGIIFAYGNLQHRQ